MARKSERKKVSTFVATNPAPPKSASAWTTAAQAAVRKEVRQAASQSLAFLQTRQVEVAGYGDFDVFVDREDSDKVGNAIEYHLVQVRAALAASLWRRQIFVGVDVIDRLLFDILRRNASRVVHDFFDVMFAHGVPSAGLVVYPLHSFGVLGLGLFTFLSGSRPEIVLKQAKMAVGAQSNRRETSIEFLERSAIALSLDRKIDRTEIDHFIDTRSLKWFDSNPLLVVSISTLTSNYYENQFIYILKLKLSTALIMMLSALGDQEASDNRLLASSSARVNNRQTLDIHHYLVFEPSLSDPKMLQARCVPMNAARLQLSELSDLNVEIYPRTWTRRSAGRQLEAIRAALETVEAGYLKHHILGKKGKLKARVYRKLVDSLDYFRRSHSAGANENETTVSLAIAFDTLLMDAYASGVTKRLHRRVRLALKGVPGVIKYRAAVVDLFVARGAIVHSGRTDSDFDLLQARRAYVHCFVAVAARLNGLPNKGDHPIGRLLGEVA